MNNEKKEDWALEQDLKYNRLTAFKLFAMTSSMVISVDELASFGKTGATALFYLLITGIAWFIPKLNGSTLLPLFHLCWHSAVGKLQFLTLKTWTILVLIQKLCLLWPL
ncbi:hypothetical protein LANSK_14470 [Lactobacillus amylovorus subsp. amylovorus]